MSLTAWGDRGHNPCVAYRRRSVLAVLLVFAFAGSATLAPCAGWQTSAKARMACCAEEDHECSQARADDCCAAGEQRQHGETAGVAIHGLTAAPVTAAVHVVAPVLAGLRAGSPRSDTRFGSPHDTQILLSVFRI
jgi:hypothetical protein